MWNRVALTDAGCWQWLGSIDTYGYGKMRRAGRYIGAHRYVYIALAGPVPEGWQVDHECKNKLCVRPGHTVAKPQAENLANRDMPVLTRCPQGHTLTEKNTVVRARGHRACRTCALIRNRQEHGTLMAPDADLSRYLT